MTEHEPLQLHPPVHRAVRIKMPPCEECGYAFRDGHAAACAAGQALRQQINDQLEWELAHPWARR
jgi:hypothetical protein